MSDCPSPPVGHIKLSEEPHLYESEVTLLPHKVSAHSILYDKLSIIHPKNGNFEHFCLGSESYLFLIKVFVHKYIWLGLLMK